MKDDLALSKKEEEWFGKELIDSFVMAGMLMMVIMVMMPFIQKAITMAASPRVPVMSQGLEPIAGNAGMMWYEMTPLGQPNRLKMVGENSSGAFEVLLLALST